MRQWISRSLLIGGVFLLVWLVVIYSWRASNRLPSNIEVGAYFLGFPLLVLGTLWLGRKVVQISGVVRSKHPGRMLYGELEAAITRVLPAKI